MGKKEDKTNNKDKTTEALDIKKYTRKKGDFELDVIDPVQDIMTDEELDEANKRIESLLDD
jgi:hypothetical protein